MWDVVLEHDKFINYVNSYINTLNGGSYEEEHEEGYVIVTIRIPKSIFSIFSYRPVDAGKRVYVRFNYERGTAGPVQVFEEDGFQDTTYENSYIKYDKQGFMDFIYDYYKSDQENAKIIFKII
jgi:hypothetical protein